MKNLWDMKVYKFICAYMSLMVLSSSFVCAQEVSASKTGDQTIRNSKPEELPINVVVASQPQAVIQSQGCDEDNCQQQKIPFRTNVPLGARISDALTRQDRESAAEILEHERLLLNDEMNLLSLVDRNKEAADVAFILMERSAQDESLYEQASSILMKDSRHSGVMTTISAFENYTAVNNQIITFGHPMGSMKVDFMYFQEARSNFDTALLNEAINATGCEIAFNQGKENYSNILKVTTTQAFNTQNGISFNHFHNLGARLKLDVQITNNQTAIDNAALRIIGRVNQFSLDGVYSIDGYNQWIVGGGHNQYSTVDGQDLGSGDLLTSTLSHELSAIRPALHARITGSWSQFQVANTILNGYAASLIPSGSAKSASYFMPQNVEEVAAYLRIGDTTDSFAPSHDLEAFTELGVFDNASTGTGWRGSAGFAGRLIGADRLQLFMRYDQSPNGQGFSSWEAGIGYLLHY